MLVCGFILLLSNILVIPWWLNTYYVLADDGLHIKMGFFVGYKKAIPYSAITSIKETRNPLASVALSLDRIEIKFETKDFPNTGMVLISPKNKRSS